jgi:hypothetical protein
MENIFLFLASFLLVFLLGFQQLNVQHRKYFYSAITSIGIAATNYVLFKVLPAGGFELIQFLFFSAGGAAGVVSSMVVHDFLMPKQH